MTIAELCASYRVVEADVRAALHCAAAVLGEQRDRHLLQDTGGYALVRVAHHDGEPLSVGQEVDHGGGVLRPRPVGLPITEAGEVAVDEEFSGGREGHLASVRNTVPSLA